MFTPFGFIESQERGTEEFCCFFIPNKIQSYAKNFPPIFLNTKITEIVEYFLEYKELKTAPVVCEENRVRGTIERRQFFEEVVIGRFGYGIHLNSKKRAIDLMKKDFFAIEGEKSLEECALRFSEKINEEVEKDIIVTQGERYYGIIHLKALLFWLAKRAIFLARDQNPLTGLPGNWAIRAEVERRLNNNEAFEVIYLDLNDFKPFNDTFGFAKGDEVIVLLGEILKDLACSQDEFWTNVFIGHIGGDDFVVIVPLGKAEDFCQQLIKIFETRKKIFFSDEVWKRGFYTAIDRQGIKKNFPLLTLSCAIVPSYRFESYGELSSISSEVKAMAKKLSKEVGKSAYFRDRRRKG